jgi:ribonuclease J
VCTRVKEEFSKTESDVEKDVATFAKQTQELVICTYPERDLDRLLSFYTAAIESGRDMVIGLKQAYLLKLFQTSEYLKAVYPRPDDKRIRIYIPRRSWGLICKDINEWSRKQLLEDYDGWEEQFLDYTNMVDCRDVSAHQNELIFYCNDFHLQGLIDIKPHEKSNYIRSSTEPFDDEMKFDEIRAKKWLAHFGLLTDETTQWHHTHVSGARIRRSDKKNY